MDTNEKKTTTKTQHVFELRPHPWGWYVLLNGDNIARFQSRAAAQAALIEFERKAQDGVYNGRGRGVTE